MIHFDQFDLKNGLRVFVNTDRSTTMVSMNIMYNVGAKDEDENRTGFAHLFEHLMFGGSKNIPNYDQPLEKAGGENNAWTNNDLTDYYLTLPAQNIETAFWLESDRMLELAFSPESLEVQRQVVIEEFKQRYLNQPYGDLWLLMRPLAYKVHPYKWNTIGKDISHIEKATLDDVKNFFFSYYAPDNAVMSISGNISTEEVKTLTEKWFSDIPARNVKKKTLPKEPVQTAKRTLTVERNVPSDVIFKAWHTCARMDKDFYANDLMTDILSKGKSARLFQRLVKERKLFSNIDCYLTGDIEENLIVVKGMLMKEVTMEQAEEAINEELEKLKTGGVSEDELKKVKQMVEAAVVFSEINIADKALNLSYYATLGDAGLINRQVEFYNAVKADEIKEAARKVFREENSNVLYYKKEKK
jgi:predicted Zn-dependent peptidase